MVDVFAKRINDVTLEDVASELPKIPRLRSPEVPSALESAAREIMRQQVRSAYGVSPSGRRSAGTSAGAAGGATDATSLVAEIPTWEQMAASTPGYEQLPFSEQQKLYDAYVKNVAEKAKAINPELDDFTLDEAIRMRAPGPAAPDRTWGEFGEDIARGLGAGGVGFGSSITGFINPASQTTRDLQQTAQGLTQGMSAVEQDAQKQIAFELQQIQEDPESTAIGRFLREIGVQVRNMSTGQAANLVGSMLPSLVASGGAGLGLRGLTALNGIEGAAAQAIARRGGIAVGAALEGVSSGGEAASNAYTAIMDMDDQTLLADPEFQQVLAESNGDMEMAKGRFALSAARTASLVAGAAGVALSALPGSAERIGAGIGAGSRGAAGNRLRNAAIGTTAEGLTEVVPDAAANQQIAQVDPSQRLLAGGGANFALGALGGAGSQVLDLFTGEDQVQTPERALGTQPAIDDRITRVGPGRYRVRTASGTQEINVPGDDNAALRTARETARTAVDAEQANITDDQITARIQLTEDPNEVQVLDSSGNWQTITGESAEAAMEQARAAVQQFITAENSTQDAPEGVEVALYGTQLLLQPDGSYVYAPDATPNPQADAFIRTMQPTTTPAPEAVDEPDPGPADIPTDADTETGVDTTPAEVPEFDVPDIAPDSVAPITEPDVQAAAVTRGETFTNRLANSVSAVLSAQANRLQNQLAPLIQQLQSGLGGSELVHALHQIRNIMVPVTVGTESYPELIQALDAAAMATEDGPIAYTPGNELAYVVRQLGYGQAAGSSPAPWAEAVRGQTDGESVLQAIANDPSAGTARQNAAAAVLQAYRASGVPIPTHSFDANAPATRYGTYNPRTHTVRSGPATSPSSPTHEYMHGLTVRGINALAARAREGNTEARQFFSLLLELRRKLQEDPRSSTYYASTATYRGSLTTPWASGNVMNLSELVADLLTPDFLAYAAQMQVGELPPNAQAAATRLGLQSTSSVFDAIVRSIRYIIDAIAPGAQLPEGSIAELLAQAASYATTQTMANTPVGDFGPRATPAVEPAAPAAPDQASTPTLEFPAVLTNAPDTNTPVSPAYIDALNNAIMRARESRDAGMRQQVQAFIDRLNLTQGTANQLSDFMRNSGRVTPEIFNSAMARLRSLALSRRLNFRYNPTTQAPRVSENDLTPEQLTTAVDGLHQLARSMEGLGNALGFRGLEPTGVLTQAPLPADASEQRRKNRFLEAMTTAIAQLNQQERAAGSGTTWELTRRPGARNFNVIVRKANGTGNSVTFHYDRGRGGTSQSRDELSMYVNTAGLPRRSGIGYRFYDALYGALSSAGIPPKFTGYTGANTARMPINRLRSMLKWGTFHGFEHAANILSMDGSGQLPNQSLRSTPEQTLVHVLQNSLENSLFRGLKFIPETHMFRLPGGTEANLNDLTQGVRDISDSRLSPDAVVLGAVVNSMVDPDISTDAVVAALTEMQHPLFEQEAGSDGVDLDYLTPLPETDEIGDGGVLYSKEAPLPGTTKRQTNENAGYEQATDEVVGDLSRPVERESYGDTVDRINSGQSFPAATPFRSIFNRNTRNALFGMLRGQRPPGGVTNAIWQGSTDIANRVNRNLHDHLGDLDLWLRQLGNLPGATARLAEAGRTALGFMRRAPGIRNEIMHSAMNEHGGKELNEAIARIARRLKITSEDAMTLAGYWLSAKRAPTGNRILIERDTRTVEGLQNELVRAQEALAEDPSIANETAVSTLARQLQLANAKLIRRVRAVNNTNTRPARHLEGVAGFSNTQAAEMAASIEARVPTEMLEEVSKHVSELNAYRIVVDIESGRKTPEAVAAFMEDESLIEPLQELQMLSRSADAQNADSQAALDAKRREVIERVRSDYVPLTGDPNRALFEDLVYDARQPNTRRDYRLEGRTASIPDDGVSSTLSGLLRSASYAGWAPFQDAIADVYNEMTDAQRREAGLFRRTVDFNRSTGVNNNGIMRVRGNRSHLYTFRNDNFIKAIRNETMSEGDALWQGLGQLTRGYAYAATQLNPWFAPRNMFRDFWERSEILRQRTLHDDNGNTLDANRIGREMFKMLFTRSKPLIGVGWNYALGRKTGGNSVEGRYFREMLEGGAASIFRDRLGTSRTNIIKLIEKESNPAKLMQGLDKVIGAWNRPFDFAAPLASYIAMREAGVNKEEALSTALDLMNFRKRGEKMNFFSSLYAFAQPAVTGGANALGSLYDRSKPAGKRWNKRGLVRMMTYTVAFTFARALMLSLSDEDEGGNKLAQQSDYLHDNYLLIPAGDKILRIPLAFGLTRVANGIAGAMLGVGSGDQTPGEAFGQLWSGSVLPVFSPIEDVDIDGKKFPVQRLLYMFSPTFFKPFASVGMNITPWGTKVVQDQWADTDQYKSEQFGRYIPEIYGDVAKELRKLTGIDMAPEQIRTLIRGIPMGIVGMARDGIIEGKGYSVLTKPIYSEYSEAARYFQFKEAYEASADVERRKNAGDTDFTAYDRKQLAWREWWDEIDKDFRNRKSRITRDKSLSDKAKLNRKAAIDEERRRMTYVALYKYRTQVEGKSAARVDVPRELTDQ